MNLDLLGLSGSNLPGTYGNHEGNKHVAEHSSLLDTGKNRATQRHVFRG